jgi:hypothetical protein
VRQKVPKTDPTIEYKCDICEIKLVSKEQLDIHLVGKKHMKKLAPKPNQNVNPNPEKKAKDNGIELNDEKTPIPTI